MHSEMDDTAMDEFDRPIELTAERRVFRRRLPRNRVWVAVLALVAFSGFTWYAIHQATKVGEEGVAPLIKADAGPTRIKPDEPGGMDVPDQDKSVYQRMEGQESGTPKVESLLPAPEAPMPPPAQAANAPATAASASTQTAAAAPTTSASDVKATDTKSADAKPAATESTQTAALPPPPPPSAAEAKAAASVKPAAGTPAPASTEAAMTGSDSAKAGSYRVQLAAVRSQDAADGEWKKLQKAYPDLLSSLSVSVVKVDIADKGTFFRVQAGALSQSAAKELCSQLKQRKAECIVVKS